MIDIRAEEWSLVSIQCFKSNDMWQWHANLLSHIFFKELNKVCPKKTVSTLYSTLKPQINLYSRPHDVLQLGYNHFWTHCISNWFGLYQKPIVVWNTEWWKELNMCQISLTDHAVRNDVDNHSLAIQWLKGRLVSLLSREIINYFPLSYWLIWVVKIWKFMQTHEMKVLLVIQVLC